MYLIENYISIIPETKAKYFNCWNWFILLIFLLVACYLLGISAQIYTWHAMGKTVSYKQCLTCLTSNSQHSCALYNTNFMFKPGKNTAPSAGMSQLLIQTWLTVEVF